MLSSTASNARADPNQHEWSKLLPAVILGVYYINLWIPPWFHVDVSWYVLLVLAIFAYLIQGKRMDARATSLFWVLQGLTLVGAVLSLFRAPNFDESLYNTAGMAIGILTMLLFVPTLSMPAARKVLLISNLIVALMWMVEVQIRLADAGSFEHSYFITHEDDKNRITLLMALAATSLFAFAVVWKPGISTSRIVAWLLRIVAFVAGSYMFYTLSLTYSRSGLLTAFSGLLAVLLLLLFQGVERARIFRFILGASLVAGVLYYTYPKVLKSAPDWTEKIDPVLNIELPSSFAIRRTLIEKGLAIIQENPILGIGIGSTKSAGYYLDTNYPALLIHNQYLSYWAEAGILGLFSSILFILAYLRLFKQNFLHMSSVDQIWMILFLPFFVGILFLDVGSYYQIMLALLAGFYYEQYMLAGRDGIKPIYPGRPLLPKRP